MPETIEDGIWRWYDVKRDLVVQGGLTEGDVVLDPLSAEESFMAGTYKEKPFTISWIHNVLLLVSSNQPVPELVRAFAKVVGYEPFAQYRDGSMITTEWAKEDAPQRWIELQREQKPELTRLLR